MSSRRRWESIAIVVVVAVLLVAAARAFGGGTSVLDTPETVSAPVPVSVQGCAPAFDDGTVALDDLPGEALVVLVRIEEGGPFEFDQDGRTFQNRERHLPRRESGYYEEYTVPTPGESDRGARRIVTGECGERYYTDDHYDSFDLIVE